MTKFEFEEVVDKYLDRFENLDEKTKYNRKKRLTKHFYPFVEDGRSVFFTEGVIKKFVEAKRKQGYKDSYIKLLLLDIREFLEWADKKGKITGRYEKEAESIIFRGITYKNRQKKEVQVYSNEDIKIIRWFYSKKEDGEDTYHHPILGVLTGFLLHTGLRLNEAVNVKLSDIEKEVVIKEDLALDLLYDDAVYDGLITLNEDFKYLINKERPVFSVKGLSKEIRKEVIEAIAEVLEELGEEERLRKITKTIYTIKVRQAKFGKERITKMLLLDEDPIFAEIFEIFLKAQNLRKLRYDKEDMYLFSYDIHDSKDENKIIRTVEKIKESTVKTLFSRHTKQLKALGYDIEIKAHTFRRTYATRLAERGYPLEVVKEILGHENISTTSKYYMNLKNALKDVV